MVSSSNILITVEWIIIDGIWVWGETPFIAKEGLGGMQ